MQTNNKYRDLGPKINRYEVIDLQSFVIFSAYP